MRFTKLTMLIAVLVAILVLCGAMLAQTSTTGSVAGTVTDTSGAVIVGAQVALTNVGTSATDTSKTNAAGLYTFPFEKPGSYKVTASSTGFVSASQPITVALGVEVTVNLRLAPAGAQEVVEVTGEAGAIQTENANLITNFNQKSIEQLPNPGNDLSAVALTAPGVVMNTSGGSIFGGGNFEVYGISATSNLFMIDGANDNDPYFNINNSGATNLMLGLNDIQEATVITNGYSGQYGGLAGANINYISKSGTNSYHGNLIYWWNGDYLDANTYFFNQGGEARPFVNANQYAGSLGGPIKKDKAFFFLDYEALRLVIPSPLSVNLPTAAFEANVLAGTGGLPASDVGFYTHLFNIYNGTPGYATAKNTLSPTQLTSGPLAGQWTPNGCSNYTGLGTAATAALASALPACANQLETGAAAHTTDYLAAGRVDYILSNKDKMYLSIHHESGLQATYTDPVNPAFTGVSQQPQWAPVQFSETHTFGSNKVNNFLTSLTWYSAFFGYENLGAEQALLPQQILFADGSLYNLNGFGGGAAPGGRNITRYQFTDDFSWSRGKHTIKFGAQYYRSDVTDLDLEFGSATPITVAFSLADFADGGSSGSLAEQFFPQKQKVPIALYQLGLYLDDEVKVTPNLKLTLSVRTDHLSNPVCQQSCFSQFATGSFYTTNPALPVNQQILANQKSPFPSVTGLIWQPKIGFAWSPFGSKKTVVRGGAGVFVDAIPTGAIVDLLLNAPLDPLFEVFFGALNPADPGSLLKLTAADNTAFVKGFSSGAAVPPFNYYAGTAVKPPRYYEWDLELQREVGWRTTVSAKYVGNHGSFEAMSNAAVNAFGFANLPLTVPDPSLATVTQVANIANSNYNGVVVSAQHAAAGGFQFQASYTFSHALDEISNNPFTPFGLASQGDMIFPQNPFNVRQFNYANATYDIRHYFNMNYVWSDAFRHLTSWGPNALMKGWNFSGTIFYHTGFPTTLFSSAATSAANSLFYGNTIFASQIGPSNVNCPGSAALLNNPCYNANNFATPGIFVNGILSVPEYGIQTRNQFRGPGLFDTDLGVDKAFPLPRWEGASVSIGLRAFNLFNHPNFNLPVANLNNGQFGSILSEVNTPTGIFGSGLGAANSPRLVQLQAKLVF